MQDWQSGSSTSGTTVNRNLEVFDWLANSTIPKENWEALFAKYFAELDHLLISRDNVDFQVLFDDAWYKFFKKSDISDENILAFLQDDVEKLNLDTLEKNHSLQIPVSASSLTLSSTASQVDSTLEASFRVCDLAAFLGSKKILNHILEEARNDNYEMTLLGEKEGEIFRHACANNQIDIAKMLYSNANNEVQNQMLRPQQKHKTLRKCCSSGFDTLSKWIYRNYSEEDKASLMKSNRPEIFLREACRKHQFKTAKWFHNEIPSDIRQNILSETFTKMCEKGEHEAMNVLYNLAEDKSRLVEIAKKTSRSVENLHALESFSLNPSNSYSMLTENPSLIHSYSYNSLSSSTMSNDGSTSVRSSPVIARKIIEGIKSHSEKEGEIKSIDLNAPSISIDKSCK